MDTILGRSQNFTDTVWIVVALGQGLCQFKKYTKSFRKLETQ